MHGLIAPFQLVRRPSGDPRHDELWRVGGSELLRDSDESDIELYYICTACAWANQYQSRQPHCIDHLLVVPDHHHRLT
ncbi:hypothetical protein HZS61_012359 [Fusarium oxysporum f. sp. conglutinans]|uniref:Uncharacterized protein n=1 Tax=Fusarium oxysporum f. sp. conglutinans TaxID=100902 RepID=A0A8H6GV14_FUSOX|nr:hypothetical protein HZS61_012359 [Fusarium oxysporum f. sp. conglutinans]